MVQIQYSFSSSCSLLQYLGVCLEISGFNPPYHANYGSHVRLWILISLVAVIEKMCLVASEMNFHVPCSSTNLAESINGDWCG